MPIEPGSFSLGVVAGGLIVGVANHYLAKIRAKEDRGISGFNNAAIKFRSTIVNELAGLYPIQTDMKIDISSRINSSFPKIQSAVEEFKPFVVRREARAFANAWKQYYIYCKYTAPEGFAGKSLKDMVNGVENSIKFREKFKHNIDLLLSFAKITLK